MEQQIRFPQYRKYKNNRSYFKIISPASWEEIQLIGSKAVLHSYEVKILPDRNFISDMLYDYERNWDKIDEATYDEIRLQVL